ncbi:MAG: hypothetical protein VKL39_11705 [Leptolyngbyaceae bacterium]|nr:hypothetical protein [Leptolyngbyaceae bacterium]
MSEDIKNPQTEGELSDDQLEGVAGGLSGRHAEEFEAGLGNKGLSGRHAEEFEAGLGNKGLSDRHSEEFKEGLGNQ